MKNTRQIISAMPTGKWQEGVILHELAHAWRSNFIGKKAESLVAKTWRNASTKLRTRYNDAHCNWTCDDNCKDPITRHEDACTKCERKDCGDTSYAMNAIHEYFATITSSVFKVGDAGTGDICKFDKKGCKMIKKVWNPSNKAFMKHNLDPRIDHK